MDDNNTQPPHDESQEPEPASHEEATEGEASTEDAGWTPDQPKVNFQEDLKVTEGPDESIPIGDVLALVRESYGTVVQVMTRQEELLKKINQREEDLYTQARKAKRTVGNEEGNVWFRTLMNALTHAQINEMGENSAAREDSEWRQVLDYEGQSLRAGQPKQRLSGGHHSTEEKMTYLSRRAGTGTVFDVPLYHSGVWLRLKTPPLSALTNLKYQMGQLKVTLGSDSKGMAFSNTSQALTSLAVDFALQYVIDANVHFNTPSDLKEKILLLDASVLLWGLAVTLFPKGFPYAHPCVANPDKCQHITKETLNLNRLFWTDSVSLSQTQKKLMARRFQKKLTDDEYQLYHTEHVRGNRRVVWFDSVGLTLKVPNLQEYEDAGHAWIEGIIEMTHGAFNEPPHGANRDQYISQLGMATTARQYAHWVVEVHDRDVETGESEVIGDDEEITNEALNHIFSADEYVENFFGEITRYMDDCLLSMVAIPSFNCPECHNPISEKFHERFTHLVPLDVLTTFFTLVNRKHS